MLNRSLALLAACCMAPAALASDVALDVNTDAFHFRYDATNANRTNLSTDITVTDDNGSLFSVGLLKKGATNPNSGLNAGLGLRAFFLDGKGDDAGGLSLGGSLDVGIPNAPDLSINTELFYAPSVLISDEFDNAIDFALRVNYKVFENGYIYGGMRVLQADLKGGQEVEIDKGLHIGIKIEL